MKKAFTPLILSVLLTSSVWANEADDISHAIAQFDKGELQSAQGMFSDILKRNDTNVDALVYLSRIHARNGNLDDAESLIEKALKIAPKNAKVQNLSGNIYGSLAQSASMFSALGYAKDSLKGYTKAVELEPDNLDYRLGLLNFHLYAPGIAGGDEDIALVQAKAIAQLDEKQGYMALAEAYFARDDEKALKQHLASMPDTLANDLDVLFSRAMMFQRGKKLLKSEEELKRIISLSEEDKTHPTRLSALYQLGKLSVVREKNIEQGIAALTEYLEVKSKQSHLPDDNWASFRLANLIALNGDKGKAESMYKQILSSTHDERLKKEVKKSL